MVEQGFGELPRVDQVRGFTSEYSKSCDQYKILVSLRPAEAILQEWLLGEIHSNNALFTATQNYSSMSNPDRAAMLPCLHHQRNLQRENQLLDRAPRLTTTTAARPARPSREIVLAIYGGPQVFRSGNRALAFRSDIVVRDPFVRVGVLVPTLLHTNTRLRESALGLMLLLGVEWVGRCRTALGTGFARTEATLLQQP